MDIIKEEFTTTMKAETEDDELNWNPGSRKNNLQEDQTVDFIKQEINDDSEENSSSIQIDTAFVDCKMEADSGYNIMDCVLDPQSIMTQYIKTEDDFSDENIDLNELKKERTDEITQNERISEFDSKLCRYKKDGEKTYQCDLCYKTFTTAGVLNRHKQIHSGDKSYKCNLCEKAFATSGYLTKHELIHLVEKPYKCDLCVKEFTTSSNLTKHKRIHSGEKPYKCDLCEKEYFRSDHLTTHKQSHTGGKPYKCDLCHKTFSKSSHLTRHKLIHSGEKPYKCDLCKKEYSRLDQLTKHKQSHTEESPYKLLPVI